MKKYRNAIFYTAVIGIFSILIYLSMHHGMELEKLKTGIKPSATSSSWDQFIGTYSHNFKEPLAILLLQIITIIVVARGLGILCTKINQPSVIGEILAGILLGPSFLGQFFPDFAATLFPKTSLGNLQFLSQIGLILFMFVIGMELDLKILKNKASDAIVISHASIVFPFTLGITLAYFMYSQFAPQNINFTSFALFIGIAMSITAFPVLARIVQERGLTKTRLGAMVITCAAADDITAWCLLAVVIAIVKAGSFVSALYTIVLAVVYVFLMLKLVQPFLKKIGEKYSSKETMNRPIVAIFFIMLLASAYLTEYIGIHALFGAFMAGVIMPTNTNFRSIFIEKVEDVALVILLPLFFVYTGLRTQIGLLNDPHLWKWTIAIVLVASAGKIIGSSLSAKFVGQPWKESLSIGALMNTRGLMELIVLNIGYDLGVLSTEVFTMMVIMALSTTFFTGPLMNLIGRLFPNNYSGEDKSTRQVEDYNILVSFRSPEKGLQLLRIANFLTKKKQNSTTITTLHLSLSSDLNAYNQKEYEDHVFQPLLLEADKNKYPIIPYFQPSENVDDQITDIANNGNYDFLIIGIGSSVFEGTILGRLLGFTTKFINPERLYNTFRGKEGLFTIPIMGQKVQDIVESVNIPIGIFIDKGLNEAKKIVIPIFSLEDSFLLIYAKKFIYNNESIVLFIDANGIIAKTPELKETIRSLEQNVPNNISLQSENNFKNESLEKQDLMLISLKSWKNSINIQNSWLSHIPSLLIIKS